MKGYNSVQGKRHDNQLARGSDLHHWHKGEEKLFHSFLKVPKYDFYLILQQQTIGHQLKKYYRYFYFFVSWIQMIFLKDYFYYTVGTQN